MPGWKRTYWSVWSANLITAIGMMSFLPFFPSYLEQLGLSERAEIATWAGVIFGAAPFSAAFMAPVWGALGDRFGRKLMTARAMVAITVFVGCMGFATSPLQLLFLRLGQGVFSGFVAPSITLVSVAAPADRQGQVTGSLQTALGLGAVIGPALGGLVGSTVGLRYVFFGVAVASSVSALLVALLARERKSDRRAAGGETTPAGVLRGAARDLRQVWANPHMRGVLVLTFWLMFGMGATNPLLEIHVGDLTGAGEKEVARLTGLLFSVMAIVNIVALPCWGRVGDRVGHREALSWCVVLSSAALFLHALAPTLVVLFVVRALLGASVAGATPLAYGLAAAEIPVDRRGGAFGALFGARTLALSTASMLGGLLSRWVGIRGLFAAGAALVLLSMFSVRRR